MKSDDIELVNGKWLLEFTGLPADSSAQFVYENSKGSVVELTDEIELTSGSVIDTVITYIEDTASTDSAATSRYFEKNFNRK